MSQRRIQLQVILEKLLGSENVYFQPPANLEMEYDCIRYSRIKMKPTFANNSPYLFHDCYQVIAITKNPNSDLPNKIASLPMCSHDSHYTAENLHHDVFTLYY